MAEKGFVSGRDAPLMPRPRTRSRLSPRARRYSILGCLLLAVFVIYWFLNWHGLRWYYWPYKFNNKWKALSCQRTEEYLHSLSVLAADSYKIFDKLGVTTFPVYGTLFGALRYRGPVPWDEDIDLGVRGEHIDRYSLAELQAAFKEVGMKVHFESYGGLYKLEKGKVWVDVFPFYNYYGTRWMYRKGWESYVLFINYWYHHIFPAALLKEPLPKIEFGGVMMNMTHGRYELQKYHFSHDWDREMKPPGCETAEMMPRKDPVIVEPN